MNADHFFATARERERIRRKRLDGQPSPWTDDPIFREWRFTNVHRENDKTTAWFRENVRKHLGGLAVVEATIAFRWFNRIESMMLVKDLLLNGWNRDEAYARLKDVKPVVTGAYMMHSPYGMPKLEGMLHAIELACPRLPVMVARWGKSQREAHADICSLDNMGSFSAGEVVWDLRWTDVLENAEDINTWTNAGPGCARGLGYIVGDNPNIFSYGSRSDQDEMLTLMLVLLGMSKDPANWPSEWEPWELHEVEMWLCEYAKYRSAMKGERLKRRYQ